MIKHSCTPEYKVSCCDIRVTVDYDKDEKPIRVRIQPSRKGGCHANQDAISHLATALLELGKLDVIKEALQGIRCGSCVKLKNALKDKHKDEEAKEYLWSCSDAVLKALEESKAVVAERVKKEQEEAKKKEEKEKKEDKKEAK